LVVNVIYCDLPHAHAVSEVCKDVDTHNIYIQKSLPPDWMREEIKHKLLHIINDGFCVEQHVNLVEQMVHRLPIDESDLEYIDFYHHILQE
jgi:hypothetical protein